MEIQRAIRYPVHGRAQVALSNTDVRQGRTVDIATAGVCILLDDQIPVGGSFLLRFELYAKGKTHVLMAKAKSVYGVFSNQGGFRAGFQFLEEDMQRTQLIKSLGGKKPMVDPEAARAAAQEAPPVPMTPADEVEVEATPEGAA